MNWLLRFIIPFQTAMRQSVASFIRLETAADERTLVTFVRIDGSRQIICEDESRHITDGATIKISSQFGRQGHALQMFFVRDPERIKRHLEQIVRPSRIAANNIELNIDNVFDERI